MTTKLTPPNSGPDERQGSDISVLFWLALMMALGLYLRLPTDLSYNFNMDEWMNVDMARVDSLGEVLRLSRYGDHPPLLCVFVHYWMKISDAPSFVRSLPLLLGMLMIPLYYLIGRRIGGKLCGLCCAALIAVSHGCIIQSYVVRQYCVFLLFISLSFYCYLCWRESRRRSLLLWYVLWGWLAALSHFSAIFFYFSLTLFETGALLCRRMERRTLIEWLFANLAVAAFAGFIYYLWWPIIAVIALRFSYLSPYPSLLRQVISQALSAPFIEAEYIYPTFPLLLIMPVYAFLPGFISRNRTDLYSFFILTGIACFLRMALCIAGIYPIYPGLEGRHNLWMLPLIIPAAGGMIAQILEYDLQKMGTRRIFARAIALLFAFTILFEVNGRLLDRGEMWSLPQRQWPALNHLLDKLTPSDLIVMDSEPGAMLTNLFTYMGDYAFTGASMAALAPYRNTRILFNPYYSRLYNREMLLVTLQKALAERMLDHVDQLVFMQMQGVTPPFADLMLCDALDKQIIAFPPFPPGSVPVRDKLPGKVIIMLVSKHAILEDVLSPKGKARACLDGKHDKFHGLMRPAAGK